MANDEHKESHIIAIAVIIIIIISAVIVLIIPGPRESSEDTAVKNISYDFVDINTTASRIMIDANLDNTDFVILDVRTPEEFSDGHLKNATLMDFYESSFSDDLAKLDKEKTYLVYCRTGSRSAQAAEMMIELGFKNVYNMVGGIIQWRELGYETVSE